MNRKNKEKLKKIICKLSRYTGITNIFFKLNKNRKIILGYHNVIPDEYFDNSLNLEFSISETNLKKQIEIIKQRFNVGLDLYNSDELTITFDDGYLNQHLLGSEILDENNIKGYFFYPANLIDKQSILLIDKMQYWIDYVEPGTYKNDKYNLELNLSDRNSRINEWIKIDRLLENEVSMEEICDILNDMFKFEDIKVDKNFYNLRFTPINKEGLERMKIKGHKIGAHSAQHKSLSSLNEEQLELDINKCKHLRDIGIYNTKTFCYPFGSGKEVSYEVMEKVRLKGFENALSFVNDEFENDKNDYFLPRMMIQNTGDRDYIEFVLSGVYYFIKNRKLLPKVKLVGNKASSYE